MSLLPFSGGNAGTAGAGGTRQGGFGINLYNYSPGGQANISGMGFNGHPGSARHGKAPTQDYCTGWPWGRPSSPRTSNGRTVDHRATAPGAPTHGGASDKAAVTTVTAGTGQASW